MHSASRHFQESTSDDSDAAQEYLGPQTTILMKNIPQGFSRETLEKVLDREGFACRYDFIYLPINFGSHNNFGYAFINLVSSADADNFMQVFDGFTRWTVDCPKKAQVIWSERQGLEGLIQRYRNSPLLKGDIPEAAKPLLLQDGVPVAFPHPTEEVKPLRVRLSKRRKAWEMGLATIFTETSSNGQDDQQ